jgi:hypothetical protein
MLCSKKIFFFHIITFNVSECHILSSTVAIPIAIAAIDIAITTATIDIAIVVCHCPDARSDTF